MLRTQHSGWCQDLCAKKLSFPQVICRTVPVATPRLIYHLTGALLQWRAQENLVECEKFNSFRKGQTRKVMSPPQLMNGEAREGAAGSKLGVCSHTFQMHIHMFIPSQIAGCLIHSVSSIIRSWDGLTVLLFAWEAKRVLNAVMSPTAQASFELLGVHLLSSFGNCEPDNTDYCLCVRYQAKEKYKLHLQKVSCPSTLVFRAHRL